MKVPWYIDQAHTPAHTRKNSAIGQQITSMIRPVQLIGSTVGDTSEIARAVPMRNPAVSVPLATSMSPG